MPNITHTIGRRDRAHIEIKKSTLGALKVFVIDKEGICRGEGRLSVSEEGYSIASFTQWSLNASEANYNKLCATIYSVLSDERAAKLAGI